MPSLRLISDREKNAAGEEDLGGQMSFLEHLDELRTRLIRSIVFVFLAAMLCWFVSDRIYNFLARPVQRARWTDLPVRIERLANVRRKGWRLLSRALHG